MGRSTFGFIHEWQELRRFRRLDPAFRQLVFYSEGSGDWPHLGPVIELLLSQYRRKVSYLTSDPRDPGLNIRNDLFRAFQIGSGAVRTILFRGIDCRHFAMTLVDLETFHLKRSVHPVHYVYLFHAINSTHTVYRKGAFDAYDTVLCVGPHHVEEIRKTEQVYGLKPKELLEHGSVKLDTVIAECARQPSSAAKVGPREVLIAPSWGECSLIESPVGTELIDILTGAGYRVVLRLHPMTVRRFPKLLPTLQKRYEAQPLFSGEDDMSAIASWVRSDVMISDWSGAAIEYAFGVQKPVIYVNTRQKLNNPEWRSIGLPPFEDTIRFEIGRVVEPEAVTGIPQLIEEVCCDNSEWRARVLAAREKRIYNVGRSSEVAAEYLASLLVDA